MCLFTAGVIVGAVSALVVQRFVMNSKINLPTKSPTEREGGIMKFQKVFYGDGSPFGARYEAEAWLEARGYSVGSSCVMGPQAVISRPDVLVAKWKNLTAKEKVSVDGRLEASRGCPAVLDLKEPPAESLTQPTRRRP